MAQIKLPPHKEKAALLMAEGWKQADVARELHVWPQTVSEWMKQEGFLARIDELCRDLTSQAVDLLRSSVVENVEIVLSIAKRGGEPGVVASRLKAALWAIDKVLNVGPKVGDKLSRARKSAETELLRLPEEELRELLERGES